MEQIKQDDSTYEDTMVRLVDHSNRNQQQILDAAVDQKVSACLSSILSCVFS
jgi:hypothetical protein